MRSEHLRVDDWKIWPPAYEVADVRKPWDWEDPALICREYDVANLVAIDRLVVADRIAPTFDVALSHERRRAMLDRP